MCCIGLMKGGRSRSHGQVINTKITKSSVEDIITNSRYEICQWKKKRCRIYRDCDLSQEELLAALHDETTTVSVANTSKEEYKRGFRTVVMKAPCVSAPIVIRITK